ncbi:MAG: hypothetical protein ING56_06090, partial [Rhodocyclaceae bacterium]|nr:hypothetical protein [Rhodocyclaceae bacterium]
YGAEIAPTPIGDVGDSALSRMDYHEGLSTLRASNELAGISSIGKARIRDLTGLSASSVAATAKDGDQALAYRYALKELNPFAIVGDDRLYTQHNTNGELSFFNTANGTGSTSGLTEQYLKDRAAMLFEVIKRNKDDIANDARLNVASKQLFNDVAQYITYRNGFGNDDNLKQIRFGSNASDTINGGLVGGSQDDYLYGMGGTDLLTGNQGNDYLEGGTGFDTYVFNKGDGKDTILDTDNRGQLNLGLRNRFNALRITDPKVKTGFLWADKDAGIRFEFKPLTAGATKGELILTRFVTPANITNLPPNPDLIATTDQITIKNVDLDQATNMGNDGGVLGIKLNNDKQLVMTTGVTPNPFSAPRAATEAIANNILNLPERAGGVINIATNFVATTVSKFRVFLTEGLNTQGVNSEAAFMLVNGAEEIPFNAQGYVDVEIPAGQSQKYYQFVSIGDIDTNLAGGLKVALLDDSGSIAKNADGTEVTSTLTVNFTAVDESGLPDVAPENIKHAGDPYSNPITTSGKTVSQWLIGSAGNDEFVGGSAADIIDGAGGRNTLYGNEGNDVIVNVGTMGPRTFVINAIADGGDGDDAIFAGERITDFDAAISAQADEEGNDEGGALIGGRAGQDRIVGSASQDVLLGGAGRDLILGGGGADILLGDTIAIRGSNVAASSAYIYSEYQVPYTTKTSYAFQGLGDGYLSRSGEIQAGSRASPANEEIAELLKQSNAKAGEADTIHAGGGADYVLGDGGADTLYGEAGNDTLAGGDGDDTVLGGTGNDFIMGDYRLSQMPVVGGTQIVLTGSDFLDGGDGDDIVQGNRGNSETGVSLKRTASPQRRANDIRDVRHEPRMATQAQRKSNQPTSRWSSVLTSPRNRSHQRAEQRRHMQTQQRRPLLAQPSQTANSPIGGHFRAKVSQTARPACTLWFCSAPTRAGAGSVAANDIQGQRAA